MTANGSSTSAWVRAGAAVALVALAGLVGGCGGSDSTATRRPQATTIPEAHREPAPDVSTVAPTPQIPHSDVPQQRDEPAPQDTVAPRPQAETPTVEQADPTPPTTSQVTRPRPSHGGPVRDHVSLVDNLRGRGLTVIPTASVNQPFLTAPGTILDIRGGGIGDTSIQSFDYQSPEEAANDMERLVRGGTDGARISVMWTGPPHFFLRERAFVIYVGADVALVDLLNDLLGPEVLRA